MSIYLILMLVAFICFTIAALGVAVSRVNLVAAGLAFVTLAFILSSRLIG